MISSAGRVPDLREPPTHPLLTAVGVTDHLEAAGVEERGVYGVTVLRDRRSAKAARGVGFLGGSTERNGLAQLDAVYRDGRQVSQQ